MADPARDMQFSQSYFGAKRAALTFSGVVILLSAAIETKAIPTAVGVHIPLSVAKLMFWLGAAYYTVAFFVEWLTTRALNTGLAAGEYEAAFARRMVDIAAEFGAQREIVTSVVHDLDRKVREVIVRVDDQLKEPPQVDSHAGALDTTGAMLIAAAVRKFMAERSPDDAPMMIHFEGAARDIIRSVISQIKRVEIEHWKTVEGSLLAAQQEVGEHSHRVRLALSEVSKKVDSLGEEISSLAKWIGRARRVMFYGVELAMTAIVFVVATWLALYGIPGWVLRLLG